MDMIDLNALREEFLQCRRCGLCRDAVYQERGFDGICPVWSESSGFETSFMRGKIMIALALMDGVLEKTPMNARSLFTCTLCGNCAKICPAEFHASKAIERVRALFSDIPNEARDLIASRVLQFDSPYEMTGTHQKREWLSRLGFSVPTSGKVLYFVGCTASMRLPQTAIATASVLRAAGIDFAVMAEEPCCGSVMFRTGRVDGAIRAAKRLAAAVSATGAEKIVVSCAGCLKTLREDYPQLDVTIPEVQHIVEFAHDVLNSGTLLPGRSKEPVRVTYHDPCHMGRELGIYEPPREILKSIEGVTLVEMRSNRHAAICCGAGGGLRSFDSELSKRIAARRVRDAMTVNADLLATACPFCQMNLGVGQEPVGGKIDVVDVIELLMRSRHPVSA